MIINNYMILYFGEKTIGRCFVDIKIVEPFKWGGKRYHTLNYHLKNKFGQKVFKISLDAGFTCPNRDGTLAKGGCLFCSSNGSGDFAGDCKDSIMDQFEKVKNIMHRKWSTGKYIAYFQAFSNTYAPIEILNNLYTQALNQPDVVGLAIATRPDCIDDEIVKLLSKLKQQTYLWVELGLQTIHNKTAREMNLQYDYASFLLALEKLQWSNIETCAHIILGLPGEVKDDMLQTAQTLAKLPLQGLKIHLLHLMKGTPLAKIYQQKPFPFLTQDEYVNLVVDILEILPPEMIIHRLTGDSPRNLLIGPQWSLNKWEVLNSIDKSLVIRDTWQGKNYQIQIIY